MRVCPLNLALTASTAVAMAIGDALAAVHGWNGVDSPLLSSRSITLPVHLGKQLTMTVADLMVPTRQLPALQPETPLPEVISQLTQGAIGSGWVEDQNHGGRLIGLITDGDLRRALRDHKPETWSRLKACNLMTTDPITVPAEMMAVEAIQRMEHNGRQPISVLPVVNAAGELDGLLRLHDLVQAGLA